MLDFLDIEEYEENLPNVNRAFLSVEESNSLNEEDLNTYIDEIVDWYYNDYGFPFDYVKISESKRKRQFVTLCKTIEETCIENDELILNMTGYVLANSYFPHKIDVTSKGYKAVRECFYNREWFRNCIYKNIKVFKQSCIPHRVINTMRIVDKIYSVSNFRPAAAKTIYKMFLPKNSYGRVWDMSAGWGGRLLGALASDHVKLYHATEPSTKTVAGLNEIIEEFDFDKKATIFQQGSETFVNENFYDLCFTSPPYFNTEMYADEETQSFIKYPTKECWCENFLRATIKNCYTNLKSERFCIINIANVKSYKNLVQDTIDVAREEGFEYIKTINYLMTRMPGKGINKNETTFKKEPVLVFYKGYNFVSSYYYKTYCCNKTNNLDDWINE